MMKINITKSRNGWRWALLAGNSKTICVSSEAYERPQKVVQALERYIVRGDPDLTVALEKALKKVGLDETGAQLDADCMGCVSHPITRNRSRKSGSDPLIPIVKKRLKQVDKAVPVDLNGL